MIALNLQLLSTRQNNKIEGTKARDCGFILERDHNQYICRGIIFFAPTCNNRVLVREWQIEMKN